ncbi:MAG: glycosyltransferase [Candidatus Lokiarchaeota archaeon]
MIKYKSNNLKYISEFETNSLINIIIPAWKEGDTYELCLKAIKSLKYPKIKVITSAGGSKKTIEIAEQFLNDQNFKILYQKAGGGKIKAINECLKFISKGIVCIIDSDVLISDEILKRVIYLLKHKKEKIIKIPLTPHQSILKYDLVKYGYINHFTFFRKKFKRYGYGFASNAFINYKTIKKLGFFTEKRLTDDGISTSLDFKKLGIKSYNLIETTAPSLTYSNRIGDYFNQQTRWIENTFYIHFSKKDTFWILRYILLVIISISVFILPFLVILNVIFLYLLLFILIAYYFKKIRKIVFIRKVYPNNGLDLSIQFLLKVLLYIYVDFLINIVATFEIVFFKKAYKRRKNIQ